MSNTSAEAPDRPKRARSPPTGCSSTEFCRDGADMELQPPPPPRAKRAIYSVQATPSSAIANDCMNSHQVPVRRCPLTEIEGDNSGSCCEDESEAATSRPWRDADEWAALELISNLEQAIRKDEEYVEDSACSSSNSPLTPHSRSRAAISRLEEGNKEEGRLEYRTLSEIECSFNLHEGDHAIDEEINDLLQQVEDQNFLTNICSNWDTRAGESSELCAIPSSPWLTLYNDELEDNMYYNPLLDSNFECAFGCF